MIWLVTFTECQPHTKFTNIWRMKQSCENKTIFQILAHKIMHYKESDLIDKMYFSDLQFIPNTQIIFICAHTLQLYWWNIGEQSYTPYLFLWLVHPLVCKTKAFCWSISKACDFFIKTAGRIEKNAVWVFRRSF